MCSSDLESRESLGFGVRVLVDGAWGFAASNRLDPLELDRVAAQAVEVARASATALRTPVLLDDRPAAQGRYETPVEVDPFAVPLEEKLGDLLAAEATMRAVAGLAWTEVGYGAQRDEKVFAATDGSYLEQRIVHVGAGMAANAVEGDEHQRRSFPMDTGS